MQWEKKTFAYGTVFFPIAIMSIPPQKIALSSLFSQRQQRRAVCYRNNSPPFSVRRIDGGLCIRFARRRHQKTHARKRNRRRGTRLFKHAPKSATFAAQSPRAVRGERKARACAARHPPTKILKAGGGRARRHAANRNQGRSLHGKRQSPPRPARQGRRADGAASERRAAAFTAARKRRLLSARQSKILKAGGTGARTDARHLKRTDAIN